jgi:hypothetical protein
MGAFGDPIGIRISDKGALKDGLDQIAQRLMDHPIAKGGGGDQAALRLLEALWGMARLMTAPR